MRILQKNVQIGDVKIVYPPNAQSEQGNPDYNKQRI